MSKMLFKVTTGGQHAGIEDNLNLRRVTFKIKDSMRGIKYFQNVGTGMGTMCPRVMYIPVYIKYKSLNFRFKQVSTLN